MESRRFAGYLKNGLTMERMGPYDRYMNGTLGDKEREEFESRLKEDKEFADDFKIFLFIIDGICLKAEQDNLDFGIAMKHITKEQLLAIVGKKFEKVSLPCPSVRDILSEANIIHR